MKDAISTKSAPKGCGKFLYEDDFEDKEDLFEHDVCCGTRLIKNNKLELCDKCRDDTLCINCNKTKEEHRLRCPMNKYREFASQDKSVVGGKT